MGCSCQVSASWKPICCLIPISWWTPPCFAALVSIWLIKHIWLVVSTPLKNMKVSWDDYSQYMEKLHACSKPPTRYRCSTWTISPWLYGRHFWGQNHGLSCSKTNPFNTARILSLEPDTVTYWLVKSPVFDGYDYIHKHGLVKFHISGLFLLHIKLAIYTQIVHPCQAPFFVAKLPKFAVNPCWSPIFCMFFTVQPFRLA